MHLLHTGRSSLLERRFKLLPALLLHVEFPQPQPGTAAVFWSVHFTGAHWSADDEPVDEVANRFSTHYSR